MESTMERGFTQKGDTRIPHKIIEAKRQARFNGIQHDLVDTVLRQTLGFHGKTEDRISISQFVEWTRRSRSDVIRNLAILEKRKVLIRKHTGRGRGRINSVCVNGNVEEWLEKGPKYDTLSEEEKAPNPGPIKGNERSENGSVKGPKKALKKVRPRGHTITINSNNSKEGNPEGRLPSPPSPLSPHRGRGSSYPAGEDSIPAIGGGQANADISDQTAGHGNGSNMLNPVEEKKRKAGVEEYFGMHRADFILDPRYTGLDMEILMDQAESDALVDPAVTPSNVKEFVHSFLAKGLCKRDVTNPKPEPGKPRAKGNEDIPF